MGGRQRHSRPAKQMDKTPDRVAQVGQAGPAQVPPDPFVPLEAAEALESIRAVMDVMYAPTTDEASAAAFRLIRAILDQTRRPID